MNAGGGGGGSYRQFPAFSTALNARVTFGKSIGVPMLLVNT